MEHSSSHAAAQMASLSKQSHTTIEIYKVPGANKIRRTELPVFSRLLAAMLDAGMPITQVLNTLEEESQHKTFKPVITGVRSRIESGESLSEAMAHYPAIFDELYVSMISAGEAGGLLADITARIAVYLETAAKLRGKVFSAMMYPTMVTFVTIILTLVMMIWIVPAFATIYEDFDSDLPGPTQALVNISAFIKAYFPYVFGVLVILAIVLHQYKKTPGGAYASDRFKLRLPIFGELLLKVSLARFSSTFAQLVSSGVPMLKSLEITSQAVGNRVLGGILLQARDHVEAGEPLSQALSGHREYPRMLVQMMSAGEQSGKVDEMMRKIADIYEDEVNTTLNGLTSLIEPLLIVFLGVTVGGIVVCMFLPIFKLSEIVSQ
ncbi:MAG: type II secretion system F family protein [Verrucomicrobiota bacterium]